MPAARVRRWAPRSSVALLLALSSMLASSAAVHAATPTLLGAASPEGVGPPAEPAALRGVAATVTGQPATAAAVATETVKQAASLLPPSAASPKTAPGPQSTAHALATGAVGSVQGLAAGAGAGSTVRNGAHAVEGVVGIAGSTLAHAQTRGSGALGRGAPPLGGATRHAGALLEAPARSVAGVLAAGSAAAARVLEPGAHGARSLPLVRGHEVHPLAGFGRGLGGGPPALGPKTGLFGAAAAAFAPLAQAPWTVGHAGLALGCLLGTGEARAGHCEAVWTAMLAGATDAVSATAGTLRVSRAPPFAAAPGVHAQLASHSGGAPVGSPLDSIVGGPGVVAGAAGASVAVALMLAMLVLLGPPAIRRMLPLTFSRSPAFAFALLPERPG